MQAKPSFSHLHVSRRRSLQKKTKNVPSTSELHHDWLVLAPEEALRSTADNHLKVQMKIEDAKIRNGLVDLSVDMQMRVAGLSTKYY